MRLNKSNKNLKKANTLLKIIDKKKEAISEIDG